MKILRWITERERVQQLRENQSAEEARRARECAEERRERYQERLKAGVLVDEPPLLPACEKHPWAPVIPQRVLGQPLQPATMCRECLAERLAGRGSSRKRWDQDVDSLGFVYDEVADHPQYPRGDGRMNEAWREHLEKQGDGGIVRPGTVEEEQVLAIIDDARDEELERSRETMADRARRRRRKFPLPRRARS